MATIKITINTHEGKVDIKETKDIEGKEDIVGKICGLLNNEGGSLKDEKCDIEDC